MTPDTGPRLLTDNELAPRWVVDDDGTVWFDIGHGGALEPWEALPGTARGQAEQPHFDAAYDALVELVRRTAALDVPDRTDSAHTDDEISQAAHRGPPVSMEAAEVALRAAYDRLRDPVSAGGSPTGTCPTIAEMEMDEELTDIDMCGGDTP